MKKFTLLVLSLLLVFAVSSVFATENAPLLISTASGETSGEAIVENASGEIEEVQEEVLSGEVIENIGSIEKNIDESGDESAETNSEVNTTGTVSGTTTEETASASENESVESSSNNSSTVGAIIAVVIVIAVVAIAAILRKD